MSGNSLSSVPYMTLRSGEVHVEEDRLRAQRKEARSKRAAQKRHKNTTAAAAATVATTTTTAATTQQARSGSGEARPPDGLALAPTQRPAAEPDSRTIAQAVQADDEPRPTTTKSVRFDESFDGTL